MKWKLHLRQHYSAGSEIYTQPKQLFCIKLPIYKYKSVSEMTLAGMYDIAKQMGHRE